MSISLNTPTSIPRPKKSGGQTIFWWIGWIVLTILSFFAAAAIWTPLISRHFGSIHETRPAVLWVATVFGTWMIILVPLIIVMYQKVDKAYEDARLRREKAQNRFRSIFVEKSKRILPAKLSKKLESLEETLDGGHLVTATLKDGRKIDHVFIVNAGEILGVYDASELTFEGNDVVSLEAANLNPAPRFLISNWLRLDGVPAPQ